MSHRKKKHQQKSTETDQDLQAAVCLMSLSVWLWIKIRKTPLKCHVLNRLSFHTGLLQASSSKRQKFWTKILWEWRKLSLSHFENVNLGQVEFRSFSLFTTLSYQLNELPLSFRELLSIFSFNNNRNSFRMRKYLLFDKQEKNFYERKIRFWSFK